MIEDEGIKKIVREIGNRRSIAINSLTIQDDSSALVARLKRAWKKENRKSAEADRRYETK